MTIWYRGGDMATNGKKKPPLGIMPKYIWEESCEQKRVADLKDAIKRYLEHGGHAIPLEWISEYNEISKRVTKE